MAYIVQSDVSLDSKSAVETLLQIPLDMIKQDMVSCYCNHGHDPENSNANSSSTFSKEEMLLEKVKISDEAVKSGSCENDVAESSPVYTDFMKKEKDKEIKGVTKKETLNLENMSSYWDMNSDESSIDNVKAYIVGGGFMELSPLIDLKERATVVTYKQEFPEVEIKMALRPHKITGVFSHSSIVDRAAISPGMADGVDLTIDRSAETKSFLVLRPENKYKTSGTKAGLSSRLKVEKVSKLSRKKFAQPVQKVSLWHTNKGKAFEKYMCIRGCDMKPRHSRRQKLGINFREKMISVNRGIYTCLKIKNNTGEVSNDAAQVRAGVDKAVVRLEACATCSCKKGKWRKCRCSEIIKLSPSSLGLDRSTAGEISGCDQMHREAETSSDQCTQGVKNVSSNTGRIRRKKSGQGECESPGRLIEDSAVKTVQKGIRRRLKHTCKHIEVKSGKAFLMEKYSFVQKEELIRAETNDVTVMNRRCCLTVEICHRSDLSTAKVETHMCARCRKCFTDARSLKNHLRTHTGDLPVGCELCDKRFTCVSALNRHRKKHLDANSYTCMECGKNFRLRASLQRHQVVHSGVRRFTCQVCQKKFMWPACLSRHATVHTRERPFRCEVCQKSFGYLSTLHRHRFTHTGIKPFSCPLCHRRFTRMGAVKRHLNRTCKVQRLDKHEDYVYTRN
ncbi:zinc finger protein 30-like [Liolophura sinensis]|uniref:zinc finger protein 30-like n=1 Tax=Liolophura sinensis TaxID=3198878 RepID=UPI0031585FFF